MTADDRAYYVKNRERILEQKREGILMASPEKKQARSEYMKRYRKGEHYKANRKIWRNRHSQTLYGMLSCVRQRAKKFGVPFNITRDDIHVPENCPVLGIPLKRNVGRFGPWENSPTVDKIIPSLGYVPGNVRVISARANRLKCDSTDPMEMLAVVSDMAGRLSLQQLVEISRL